MELLSQDQRIGPTERKALLIRHVAIRQVWALWARLRPEELIHDSDRGNQYLSICYTERLAKVGMESSVGSVGDSYDNALVETINGLYKSEKDPEAVRRIIG